MPPPEEHAVFLARTNFPVPANGDLTPEEREALARFGHWMDALESGVIAAVTPGQEDFIRAARGERAPVTPHERAWVKFQALRTDISGRFRALARARVEKAAVEAEYEAKRAAVLATVREQLAAVDDAFLERIQMATDAAAATEAAVRESVLSVGRGFHIAGIDAKYYAGRVTWDAAQIEQFAERHPEIRAFRKVGKPWVALRYSESQK
ncbi:MAG TPA: DUF413 domain-containing protein [Urbifossiella sp.]